jgi:outer membrane biosynthesis protein TonB
VTDEIVARRRREPDTPTTRIGRSIRRNLARFQFCYEKQLEARPNLAGEVSVRFVVPVSGGRPTGVRIQRSTLGDENVERCVEKVMASIHFPNDSGKPTVVTYPFRFATTD